MGHWMDPEQFKAELDSRFPGCMNGELLSFYSVAGFTIFHPLNVEMIRNQILLRFPMGMDTKLKIHKYLTDNS